VLLYVLMVPIVLALPVAVFKGDASRVVAHSAAIALLLWGAALIGRGLRAEAEFERRRIANPPRLPRKSLGALVVAAGVFASGWLGVPHSPVIAGCLALGALAGCHLTYGFDPRTAKTAPAGAYGYTTEEVIEALDEARAAIRSIEASGERIHNAELSRRLRRICASAREIVEVIEADPRDLRRARKFMRVYLTGAQRVCDRYAGLHPRGQSRELESSFRNVLQTIEEVFREQHDRLLENDVLDLDVQIEVLSNQLQREGVV
jgi:5-bromo-4-chloroindolyl phosphate hydrolysis protein